MEAVGDLGQSHCVLLGDGTPILGLPREPVGHEEVETMMGDSSFKRSCHKEEQKNWTLGWRWPRGGGMCMLTVALIQGEAVIDSAGG